jgi:hypothetical protein
MSIDDGFLGAGLCRSPATQRIYLVHRGLVVGEVPPEAEARLAPDAVQGALRPEAEAEYLWRKLGNLQRYALDLDQFLRAGGSLPMRSAADFRISDLARQPPRTLADVLLPRVVQLGNSGCFAYASAGWRHLLHPNPNELDYLRQIPRAMLVGDAGLPAFAERERAQLREEYGEAVSLREALTGPSDFDTRT